MTTENYVNMIVKNLKCSHRKRREIREQLLSDISAALENGETMTEIAARMGSAKEAADEFNQNLSETERKSYSRRKKLKVISSVVIVLLLLLAFMVYWFLPKTYAIGTNGVFDATTVEQNAKTIIRLLDAGDYAGLRESATSIMQNILQDEQRLENVKEQMCSDWGAFHSFGTMYMAEVKQRGQIMAVCEVVAAYEHINVTYTLLFDKELQLAGLYMK